MSSSLPQQDGPMTTFKPPLHMRPEAYCVLCRAHLVAVQNSRLPMWLKERHERFSVENQDWELSVIAFCRVEPEPGAKFSRMHHFVGRLDDEQFLRGVELRHDGQEKRVDFCVVGTCEPSCGSHSSMFYMHTCCYSMAMQNGDGPPLTIDKLHKLARLTRPITPAAPLTGLALRPRLDVRADGLDGSTDLSILLDKVTSCLPLDVREIIGLHLGESLVSSLIATRESLKLLGSVERPSDRRPMASITSGRPTQIQASTTRLYGVSYLSHVSVGDNVNPEATGDHAMTITSQGKNVHGLSVVLGPYGVQALRILFADESRSEWLGNPSHGWHITIPGVELTDVVIAQDELRLLSIDFSNDCDPETPRIFWSRGLEPPSSSALRLVHTTNRPPRIDGYDDYVIGEYLSLENISFLSVWVTDWGIAAIMTDTMVPIGRPPDDDSEAVVLTFPLHHGERINGVFLYTVSGNKDYAPFKGPVMVIGTTQDRSFVFGDVLSHVHEPGYFRRTVLLHPDEGSVATGIFADLLSRRLRGRRRSRLEGLGVSLEPKTPDSSDRADGEAIVPSPSPHYDFFEQDTFLVFQRPVFLTFAELTRIQQLECMKEGPRVVGLLITHIGGNKEVLGQWDPRKARTSARILYSEKNGSWGGLSFRFHGGHGVSALSDISVCHEKRTGDDLFISQKEIEEKGWDLGWWVMPTRDAICPMSVSHVRDAQAPLSARYSYKSRGNGL